MSARDAWALWLLAGCGYISAAERDARWDLDGDGVKRPADCNDEDPDVTSCPEDGASQPAPDGTPDCGPPPQAVLRLAERVGERGQPFVADASASTGTHLQFRFDWGDGSPSSSGSEPIRSHIYTDPGRSFFDVTLEVVDGCARGDRAEAWVAVSEPGGLLRVSTAEDEDDRESLAGSGWLGQGLSLREAMELARQAPGPQLIAFQPGLEVVYVGPNLPLLQDPDEMMVGPGVRVDGSAGGRLVFRGDRSIVAGLELVGFLGPGGALQLSGHSSLVRDLTVRHSGSGLEIEGEGTAIVGARIEGSEGAQIALNAQATLIDVVVAGGRDAGIVIDRRGANSRLSLCQLYGHDASGIQLSRDADNVSIVDSTIAGNAQHGIEVESRSVERLELLNVILAFNGGWGLAGDLGSFAYGSPARDAWYGNVAGDCSACSHLGTGSLTSDPLLADLQGGDLRPLPGSPVIDAGTPETLVDRNGSLAGSFLGAAPDIGAIEVQ